MQKNKIILLVVGVVIVAGLSFYGGVKYSQNNNQLGQGNFSQRIASSTQRGSRAFGGMLSGQVISIDSNSLIIKSQDGGSRIVFLSASTTINKMTEGNIKDLSVGSNVFITGSSNTDNTVNAQVIQIRSLKVI